MIRINTLGVLASFILQTLIIFNATAQISEGGIPPSFTNSQLAKSDFETIKISPPDMAKIKSEDSERDVEGLWRRPRMAVGVGVSINMDNSGTWYILPDGGKIWRLKIEMPDATALGMYYDNFNLPYGSKLYLYNGNKTQVIGAFTNENNHESGLFATEFVQGTATIIEYFQPYEVIGEPIFHINEIAYGYRMIRFPFLEDNKDFGDSQSCEVNVNCPAGNNWQDQKRGIARISIKIGSYYYWCSGTLLNNAKQDCIPYFLTACHCADGASTSDLNQWIFYFNWESAGCNTTTQPAWKTMTGASFRATDGNDGNNGSDFYLVRLNNTPPSTYNLYLNGWSRSTTGSPSGVSIHHPAGDIKKISTYTTTLASVYVGSPGSHWEVYWSSGVTEEGSSGSPIFNSTKQVVGDLTGGLSACTVNGAGQGTGPNKPDYYGKFSYSWASAGSTPAKRLKDWLDPNNTNVMSINGRYACQNVSVNESGALKEISIFPNPAKDFVNITPGKSELRRAVISLIDVLGNTVFTTTLPDNYSGTLRLDLSNYQKGIYFLRIDENGNTVTKKITKI